MAENNDSDGCHTPPAKKRYTSSSDDVDTESVYQWSSDCVSEYFQAEGLSEIASSLKGVGVRGAELFGLGDNDLEQMGIDKDKFTKALGKLKSTIAKYDCKVFSDPIHGPIEMHPLMILIIDTPQFQRLRSIKQLGGTYYVYPGGSHNRFEHSLGVAHLAGQLVEKLKQNQPELGITDKDVLCVKIAGLCHDLGHGPFSHMFDSIFIPMLADCQWKHEVASAEMFDHLIESNHLRPHFDQEGLNEEDIIFIKEQIRGPVESELQSQAQGKWPYKGRGKDKSFLYEIVANKKNGMDVDKWDYFARDCHHLGIGCTFDHRRYMAMARVIKVDQRMQICTRDKDVNNLYDMFYVRKILHQRAYQHKTGKAIEYMIRDALVLANEHFLIPGREEMCKMSECIDDMWAYSKLNDSILDMIKFDKNPALQPAQELIHRIESRQLYKYIGQTAPIDSRELSYKRTDGWQGELADEIVKCSSQNLDGIDANDLLVDIVTFDYGSKEDNPVNHMRFYSKSKPNDAFKLTRDHVSCMLPNLFSEKYIRLYCKKMVPSRTYRAIWKCFQEWCTAKSFGIATDDEGIPQTPYSMGYKSSTKGKGDEVPALGDREKVKKNLDL